MPRLRAFLFAIPAAGALIVAPASAAGTPAQALFDEGLTAMEAGRFAEGCPKLAESYRLDPLPGALFTLAECEIRWGQLVAALSHYEAYLERFERMSPAERTKQKGRNKVAASQVAALKTRIALQGAGESKPDASPPVASEAPPARDVVAPPEEERSPKPVWPWIVGGIGVGALAAGTVTSLIALSASSDVDAGCRNNVCNADGLDAVDKTRTFGWLGTGLLAGGAVAVGVATVVLVATGSAKSGARVELRATSGGASLRGTF